jgi:hypothetical protein
MICDAALSDWYRSDEPECMPVIKICNLRRISDNRMYLPLTYDSDIRTPAAARDQFPIGVDNAMILPMVGIGFLASTLFQAAFFVLAVASAFVFALVHRLLRSLLLVAATAGDAMAWLIKRLTDLPQLSGAKRKALRELVDRRWPRLRQRLSHEVVAMRTQSVLQRGSSWIFQRFGALSPRAALLVIVGGMVWLPLSAAISIAMHAVLLTNAAWLPAWTQLLHPVATIIAKSKLLVLAAYPAAWPQAKTHARVQAALRCMDRIVALDSIRKTAHRYQQTKQALAQVNDVGLRAMIKCIRFRSN